MKQNQNQDHELTEDLLNLYDSLCEMVIAFNPIYADVTGSTDCALLLSQLNYWSKYSSNGWIDRTQKEIEDVTRLSRRVQDNARKKLITLGIIQIKKVGIPRRTIYKINKLHLIRLMIESDKQKKLMKSEMHQNAIILNSNTYCKNDDVDNLSKPLIKKNAPKRHYECTKTPLRNGVLVHSKIDKNLKDLSLSTHIDSDPEKMSDAEKIAWSLLQLGIEASADNPKLLALINQGLTHAEIVDAGLEAKRKGILTLPYLIGVATGRRSDALKASPLPDRKISAETAYNEAVAQLQRRSLGQDTWTRPEIAYAAFSLGSEIMRYSYRTMQEKWIAALDNAAEGIKNGTLSAQIPPRDVSKPKDSFEVTSAKPKTKEKREEFFNKLESIKSQINLAPR